MILDFKKYAPEPWHKLQLEYYRMLVKEREKVDGIAIIETKATGAMAVEHDAHDATGRDDAIAALRWYRWLDRAGKLKGKDTA